MRFGTCEFGLQLQVAAQTLQVNHEIARCLVALVTRFGQAFTHDALQLCGRVRDEARERRGLVFEHRDGDVARRLALERHAPRDHFIQHHAERPHVGAWVRLQPARMLGRHVIGRPPDRARNSRRVGARRRVRVNAREMLWFDELGEAEVQHLHDVVVPDHDVRRLDVAVHDAGGVRGGQRERRLLRHVERVGEPHPPLAQLLPERHAVNVFGGDEGCVVLETDLVDGEDVRVVQRRGGVRFLLEPVEPLRVRRVLRRQQLERDAAAQPRIVRQVHLAHPTNSESLLDAVMAERAVGRELFGHAGDRLALLLNGPARRARWDLEKMTSVRTFLGPAVPVVPTSAF